MDAGPERDREEPAFGRLDTRTAGNEPTIHLSVTTFSRVASGHVPDTCYSQVRDK